MHRIGKATTVTVEPGYIVLPISALKKEVTTVFDALKTNKTVYVSRRGEIVAAFQPYAHVPEPVAALYASPYLKSFTVSARDIGQGVPSKAVNDAAAGLPSIVEKERYIYGLLTPASAPRPANVPNPEALGAKTEALLAYRQDHPEASHDDVLGYADTHEVDELVVGRPAMPGVENFSAVAVEHNDAVYDDLRDWRNRGSDVEDVVQQLFSNAEKGFAEGVPTPRQALGPSLARGGSRRAGVLFGERSEAAGDAVAARRSYVIALTAETHPDIGVMWRLGNLARSAGHSAEAARWYELSLALNDLFDHLDPLDEATSTAFRR